MKSDKCANPKRIQRSLTTEEQEIILELLKQHNSRIITQAIWAILQPILNMSSTSYSRRANACNFDYPIGYDWAEYKPNIHSTKRYVQIHCIHCQNIYVAMYAQLRLRKYNVEVCAKCYATKNYLYDKIWREKNSISQKIAQNRPETISKHRKNSKALWVGEHGKIMRQAQLNTVNRPEYKRKMADVIKQAIS